MYLDESHFCVEIKFPGHPSPDFHFLHNSYKPFPELSPIPEIAKIQLAGRQSRIQLSAHAQIDVQTQIYIYKSSIYTDKQ